VYTYSDVDRHLGLHWGTSRRWLNGYVRAGTEYPPVLREEPSGSDARSTPLDADALGSGVR